MKSSAIISLSSLFIFFYTSQFSLAFDTLTQGQSLKDGQTLLSSSSIFEFGFFTPGNSTYHYVGIWYHNISTQTVVWVANRETPLTNSNGSLTFTSDGNLVLLNDKGDFMWSTNISMKISSSTSMKAQIMDMGKLVIRSNDERVIWDSFDHPTDTFLPGMKISLNRKTGERTLIRSWKNPSDPSIGKYSLGLDPSDSGQLFIWKGRKPMWRSGQWDGTRFIGSTMRPLYLYGLRPEYDTPKGLMSFTFTYFNNSLLRFAMQWDGVENTSILVEETKGWKSVWLQPGNECETYGKCQKYGLCSNNGAPICACLKGFEPKFVDGWNNGNWSGGCVRRTQLQCELNNGTSINSNGEGDGFYKLEKVKVPDFADWASIVRNEDDCRSTCAGNCSCKAYSYVPGSGCLMWATDLIDMYQLADEGSGSDLYIKLAGSELSELGSKSRTWRTIVIISASVMFLLITCILLWWKFNIHLRGWLRKDEKQKCSASSLCCKTGERLDFSGSTEYGDGHERNDGELPLFNYDIIANATSDFSDSNKLGEGGFGGVYKGTLLGGLEIAVKKLSRNSGQGHEEFKNEMILIAKLQHRNLVRLFGYCIQGEEKMLIYEYMPNKSLDAFLFDWTRQPSLDWNKRFSIIEGIARGLVYLHRDSRLRIVHRDLKASNILLDKDMNPKISDFGMARIFGSDQNQLNTNRVVGTFGYMSPEYAMEGLFSVKSDVYSFGILVLEIVSGKKNNSFHHMPDTVNIVGYAWKLWNKDRAIELIDRAILDSCSVPQVARCIQVGLLCVQDCANDRPDMPSVVFMLGSDNVALPLPKPPLFTMERSRSENEIQVMGNWYESYSVNDVTITKPVGR